MKIGIVGNGVVGNATARAVNVGYVEVRVFDIDPTRSTHTFYATVLDTDIVFVCLPETAVDKFFSGFKGGNAGATNLVLKSTVPVGTTRRLAKMYDLPNLVHSPEFLTERRATLDARRPVRNVIGCPRIKEEMVCRCCHMLRNLYERRWPNTPIHLMSSDESEYVKLMDNSFSAIKIAAFNEFRSGADAMGLDWHIVLEAVLAGGRINRCHTQVPGPDGMRGFGGKCLPKDLLQMIACFEDHKVLPVMMNSAKFRNVSDRSPEGEAK